MAGCGVWGVGLILTGKEIKSKKEPLPTSQNYPMILSTIWNWLLKGRYNRDKKKGKTQIVFGLLCSAKGCPIEVEVFEGNTSDSFTLARQIEKVRKGWGIENVVWVSDRGILTNSKINELVKPIVRIRLYYFRTLFEDLGTICLNTVECTIREGSYRFAKITPPTQLQQSCVRFIRVVLDLYPVKGQPKFS